MAEPAKVRIIRADDKTPGLIQGLRELYRYRDLLLSWTLRDIKVRYKQSLLGAAWAILQPLSMMAVFTLVFSFLVPIPTEDIPYPVFSYAALLPWTFFATSISFGVPSVVSNMNLVTKIYFPREVFPFAAVAASFVDFLIAFVVFLGMLVIFHVQVHLPIILFPLLVIVQIILTLGVVLLAAAINVYYRDIRFVVPLAVQLLMYATPVIYPTSLIPPRWRGVYMLNPMAGLIEGYRAVLLRGEWPEGISIAVAVAVSLGLFAGGYRVFKRMESDFADVI